jgi:RimJ/RimL family protein N-acetyltransferase
VDVSAVLIQMEHADRIQELAADAAIGATSNVPSPYPVDGAKAWIAHMRESQAVGTAYAFAVVDAREGVVGVCSLMAVDRPGRAALLGYWIGRRYWGRGYATTGGRHVVEFGFRDLELERIQSFCLTHNLSSQRVLEKLGFSVVGPGPSDVRGQTLEYALTRAVWA